MSQLQEKIAYFREKQERVMDLERQFKVELAEYKAEMKQAFGITDGETMNVLGLIEAIEKTVSLR